METFYPEHGCIQVKVAPMVRQRKIPDAKANIARSQSSMGSFCVLRLIKCIVILMGAQRGRARARKRVREHYSLLNYSDFLAS